MHQAPLIEHGGPDSGAPIRHDFSSNANALPTPPAVLQAVQQAPRRHYPEPSYRGLRAQWGQVLRHDPVALLPSAGGTEAIRRLTLLAKLQGLRHVWVPLPGFGEYAAAAQALGLQVHGYADACELMMGLCAQEDGLPTQSPAWVWVTDPGSPGGGSWSTEDWLNLQDALDNSESLLAIDQAYEPLRLDGSSQLPAALAARAWRLHCPNKALALTGVRAGMIQAPVDAFALVSRCESLAPSWVLSGEGVALLQAWLDDPTQQALAVQRAQLRAWRAEQHDLLGRLGWRAAPTVCNFALWTPPEGLALSPMLSRLRELGIKLRDASSMGAPGRLRLSVQPPEAQGALARALRDATENPST